MQKTAFYAAYTLPKQPYRGTTEKQNRDKSVPAQRRLPGTRPYRGAQTAIMTMIAMFDICYAIRGVVITLIDYH